jgi:hypothetical protein
MLAACQQAEQPKRDHGFIVSDVDCLTMPISGRPIGTPFAIEQGSTTKACLPDWESARNSQSADDAADNFVFSAAIHFEITSTSNSPMPSNDAASLSPGTIGPTPSGVPVNITSPGCKV